MEPMQALRYLRDGIRTAMKRDDTDAMREALDKLDAWLSDYLLDLGNL